VGESVTEPLKYYRNNFANTQNLLSAKAEADVGKFVFSSRAAAYRKAAARNTRLPSGHPEAFLEAFANNYANFTETVKCALAGKKPDALELDFPSVDEGVRGMLFIETVVASNKSKQKWTPLKK